MHAMGLQVESDVEEADPAAAPGPSRRSAVTAHADEPRFGALLGLWMGLTILIFALLWITGFATANLAAAVEQGAARAEWRYVGELGDDLIRKAVRTQHETLTFWMVLTFLGQFLGEPLVLAVRALAVATTFAATAALRGRPIGYDRAVADCVAAQGFWVLGLAVRAALMMALRRTDIETSAALLLPDGTYPAWIYLAVAQLDPFALTGWIVVGWGGWKRGQVGPLVAVLVCLAFWGIEAVGRVGLAALVGSAMRLSLMPG